AGGRHLHRFVRVAGEGARLPARAALVLSVRPTRCGHGQGPDVFHSGDRVRGGARGGLRSPPARAPGRGPDPAPPARLSPHAPPVPLVTGGHDHDVSFYSVLDGHDDLAVTVNPHPEAFRGKLDRYRVVVLYDMVADLEPERRANLQAFVEGGGGIVGLHHTI